MKKQSAILGTLMVCLALLIAGCGGDKYVEQVQKGTMDMAPNVEIGMAFDRYFSDKKWKSFVSSDKQRVVEFRGKCMWNNRPANFMVQFIIHSKVKFEMGAMQINGNGLNNFESINIMQKILMGER